MFYLGVPGWLISGMLWFAPGWVLGLAMTVVGLGIYLIAMTRSQVLPRAAVTLLWLGVAVAALVGAVGLAVEYDIGAAAIAGQAMFAAGLTWIGAFLWSETPEATRVDVPATFA